MMSVGLALERAGDARAQAGLVGPNAVIQLAAALRAGPGDGVAAKVFAAAGLTRLLAVPPDAMIDEAIPIRLFDALWREVPAALAAEIAHEAGLRTGAYVLANRIPAPARLLLKALPARLSAPMLVKAIAKNAWTFAGSGVCRARPGRPAVIDIVGNAFTMPGCVWHVGVFEYLFRSLVEKHTHVVHVACSIEGVPTSRFVIDW